MREIKVIVRLILVLLPVIGMSACNGDGKNEVRYDTPNSGTIRISVDESYRPVIEEQIKVYEATHPGTKINAHYKPEAECLKDLVSDSATKLVVVTRSLTAREAKYFDDTLSFVPRSERLAWDAIAVVVNAKSNDTTFTLQQLQQLLTGEVNNDKKMVFDGLTATSTIRFAMDSILKGKKLFFFQPFIYNHIPYIKIHYRLKISPSENQLPPFILHKTCQSACQTR